MAATRRIDDLERSLSLVKAELERTLAIQGSSSSSVSTDPSPSQRYAGKISQALTTADSYLSVGRYDPEKHKAVIDEIIRLYLIKGLSGSQNSNLKKCFRELVQHKIEAASSMLGQMALEDRQREAEELRKLVALRFASGNSWLTKDQVLAAQGIIEGIEARESGG